ncbi:hypothetical protein [Acidovorax sp.]|uniref:hypothetical protein n=1 Tax=Acidovorax sp. TaxID=1872122 RepID=UPI00391EE97D
MIFFTLVKGKPFAHGVDVNRLAGKIPAGGPPLTKDQSLDEVAQMLGERNYHALLQRANSGNMAAWSFGEITSLVHSSAITQGAQFPRRLSRRFDAAWQASVTQMLQEAVAAFNPEVADFIALVGGPGSGKTIAAENFVARNGGHVVDVGLRPDMSDQFELAPGQVLCFDRPAVNPEHESNVFHRLRALQATGKCTLPQVMAVFREPSVGIPRDSVGMWGDSHARTLARQAPLIIAFPNEQAVKDAIQGAHTLLNGAGVPHAGRNWNIARVVNLDTMTSTELYGPCHRAT